MELRDNILIVISAVIKMSVTVTMFMVTIKRKWLDCDRVFARYWAIMTAIAIEKAPIIMKTIMPGLLDENTAKGLSPFMYSAIETTAMENSKRKSEARRTRSFFWRARARSIVRIH